MVNRCRRCFRWHTVKGRDVLAQVESLVTTRRAATPILVTLRIRLWLKRRVLIVLRPNTGQPRFSFATLARGISSPAWLGSAGLVTVFTNP